MSLQTVNSSQEVTDCCCGSIRRMCVVQVQKQLKLPIKPIHAGPNSLLETFSSSSLHGIGNKACSGCTYPLQLLHGLPRSHRPLGFHYRICVGILSSPIQTRLLIQFFLYSSALLYAVFNYVLIPTFLI
jgi:hypothetical protein